MTTLELAEKIAFAVMASVYDHGTGFVWEGAKDHAPAVLKVLHENDSWFCRMDPAKAADWPEECEQRYELVQPDLFK